MSERLPAHLEIASMIRLAQSHGGTATVIAKGERDAGTVLIVTMRRGRDARLHERMPTLDGHRRFQVTREQDPENPMDFDQYLDRRRRQDPDIWVLEVDVDEAERFVALLPH